MAQPSAPLPQNCSGPFAAANAKADLRLFERFAQLFELPVCAALRLRQSVGNAFVLCDLSGSC
jgi:hypothetical protein